MPTHTNHSAIIAMHATDGAPWNFERWQEITIVYHGLFPENDSDLPAGWTRRNAQDVEQFFNQFGKKKSQEDRIKFARGRANPHKVPGRAFFQAWLTKVWKTADIHTKIRDYLEANSLHPVSIAVGSGRGSVGKWFPPASAYTPLALESIAVDLYGPDCQDGTGMLAYPLRQPTLALINNTWTNIHKQVNRLLKKIEEYEKETLQAFKALNKEKPTQKDLRTVITKVSRWQAAARALQDADHLAKVAKVDGDLKSLMAGLGAKVTGEVQNKNLEKVTQKMRASLASPDEAADVIALYRDLFSEEEAVDYEDLQSQLVLGIDFTDKELDPGILQERHMTSDQLALSLGFIDHRPVLFNTHRHFSGSLNGWKPSESNPADRYFKRELGDADKDMVPLDLHCHQLGGVHALVRQTFSTSPNFDLVGSGVFDEVGLGKSFQALAFVGFLMDGVRRQQIEHSNPPPLIRQRPFLGDSDQIPNQATLIVAPGTLLLQWQNECQVAYRPKSVDIMLYPSNRQEQLAFWAKDGPYYSSNHEPSNRIILASHAAISKEFSTVYQSIRSSARVPWEPHPRISGSDMAMKSTLFGCRYLTVIVDEAHEFRNAGPKHSAILAILELGRVRLPMTATPLQTSTKDLAAIGRLIGVKHFLSAEAFQEEKNDQAELRRLRRDYLEEMRAEKITFDDFDPCRKAQRTIAQNIRANFGDRLLRRTLDSRGLDNQVLIKLPPLKTHTFVLTLQKWEMDIIEALTARVAADLNDLTFAKVVSTKFYIEYRMGVGYARRYLKDPIPTFESLDEWQARKSTKIDTCARICLHLLASDRAMTPFVENGKLIFPSLPPLAPGQQDTFTNKILVYQEFSSLGPLLRNIFRLYEIEHSWIDGETDYDERALRVKRFFESLTQRVFIFSQVGSVGLNISCANFLIFLDQPWSAQDERQIRGRLYRQPQARAVHCFHILAQDTADVLLSVLARNKQHMLEAFLSHTKENVKTVHNHILGKMTSTEEDEDQDDALHDDNNDDEDNRPQRKSSKPQKSQKPKPQTPKPPQPKSQPPKPNPSKSQPPKLQPPKSQPPNPQPSKPRALESQPPRPQPPTGGKVNRVNIQATSVTEANHTEQSHPSVKSGGGQKPVATGKATNSSAGATSAVDEARQLIAKAREADRASKKAAMQKVKENKAREKLFEKKEKERKIQLEKELRETTARREKQRREVEKELEALKAEAIEAEEKDKALSACYPDAMAVDNDDRDLDGHCNDESPDMGAHGLDFTDVDTSQLDIYADESRAVTPPAGLRRDRSQFLPLDLDSPERAKPRKRTRHQEPWLSPTGDFDYSAAEDASGHAPLSLAAQNAPGQSLRSTAELQGSTGSPVPAASKAIHIPRPPSSPEPSNVSEPSVATAPPFSDFLRSLTATTPPQSPQDDNPEPSTMTASPPNSPSISENRSPVGSVSVQPKSKKLPAGRKQAADFSWDDVPDPSSHENNRRLPNSSNTFSGGFPEWASHLDHRRSGTSNTNFASDSLDGRSPSPSNMTLSTSSTSSTGFPKLSADVESDAGSRRHHMVGVALDPRNPKATTAAGKKLLERMKDWERSKTGQDKVAEEKRTSPFKSSASISSETARRQNPFAARYRSATAEQANIASGSSSPSRRSIPSTLPKSRNPFERKKDERRKDSR